jgi:hypothetical protein
VTRAARGAAALLAVALPCCAESYYDRYRAAHPDWSAEAFPSANADLEQTIAALQAPPGATERTTLQSLRIVDVTGATWEEVPREGLESGAARASALRSYLVLAHVACAASTIDAWLMNEDVAWYLLIQGRVAGYYHVVYDRTCRGDVRSARPRIEVDVLRCLRDYARRSKAMGSLDVEETCGPVALLPGAR